MSGASRRIMRQALRDQQQEKGWRYTPDPALVWADLLITIGGVLIVIGLAIAISAGVWFLLADLVIGEATIAPEQFPPIKPFFGPR